MSKTKNYAEGVDKEFKIHKVKKNKSKLDKHKNFIYNMASVRKTDLDDDFDEMYDYAYTNGKIKQR